MQDEWKKVVSGDRLVKFTYSDLPGGAAFLPNHRDHRADQLPSGPDSDRQWRSARMLQGGCRAMPIGARAADDGALVLDCTGVGERIRHTWISSKRRGRDLVKSFDLITNLENDMKLTVWNVVPVLALTLAAAAVSARAPAAQVAEKTIDGVEKAKDAVVKGVTVGTEKTKEGVSKTGEVITDEWITSRVHARFVGEDLLKDSDISVVTSKHVVTLNGTVMGQAGRARATTVAKHTEGVHRVVNQLTIGPKPKV